jgi:hypothetical protein
MDEQSTRAVRVTICEARCLKRRIRWCLMFGLGGFVLFILTPVVYGSGQTSVPPVLPVIGFVMFFGAMLAVQWLTRCPKCKSRLGHEVSFRLGFPVFRKHRVLPFCGVSLDDPWPPSEVSTASQNPIK